jgi:tetratricopeptide (TPR) repeat protein
LRGIKRRSEEILTVPLSEALKKIVGWLQTEQFEKAEQLCQQVCASYPNHADALHLLAIVYARTRRYEIANEYFMKAINSAPKRGDFYGNYGNALLEQGRINDAVKYCEYALSLDAICFEVYNTLGNAMYRMGKIDEAILCYRKVIDLQPSSPEAYNNLGQALKRQHDTVEAQKCFRKALTLQPDFDKAASNLAEVDSIWLEPLHGKRVLLRRCREDDAAYLLRCSQNPEFMDLYNCFIPRNMSVESLVIKLREEALVHPSQKKSISWIIFKISEQNTMRPIGMANLVDIQLDHRKAEFLIGIPDPTDRNGSVGAEATFLVMDFAFNKIRLNKLVTFVYSYNLASQKNTLKLGFTQESFLRQHLWRSETKEFIDVYSNGITLNDFRVNKRAAKLSRRLLGRDITLV